MNNPLAWSEQIMNLITVQHGYQQLTYIDISLAFSGTGIVLWINTLHRWHGRLMAQGSLQAIAHEHGLQGNAHSEPGSRTAALCRWAVFETTGTSVLHGKNA